MSLTSPEKHWWDSPLHRDEKIWITLALIWCMFLTGFMPYWHLTGEQNASSRYAKMYAADFERLTDAFIEKYKVGEEKGIPVVAPPAGADIFLRSRQWSWDPILKLKTGKQYNLHLSSVDVNHGLSVFPMNFNFQVVPGYDNWLLITPTKAGEYTIICNEFCGIGHHTMIGRIYVES
ncbi:MAG: cytochrome C oxidase subunit II [Nitrospinae bacterium]|nr:cytochrome C oxidase subunit II [Nitrospinota bacterium]